MSTTEAPTTEATLVERYDTAIRESLMSQADKWAGRALASHSAATARLAGPAQMLSGGFDRFTAGRLQQEASEYQFQIWMADALQSLGTPREDYDKPVEEHLRFLRSYYQQEQSRMFDGAKRGEDVRAEAHIVAALREAEGDAWFALMMEAHRGDEGYVEIDRLRLKTFEKLTALKKERKNMRSEARIAEKDAEIAKIEEALQSFKANLETFNYGFEKALSTQIRRITTPSGYWERQIHGTSEGGGL